MELQLEHRTPFDAAGVLGFLAARAVAGIEEVADGRYRRSLRLPHGPAVIELYPGDRSVRCRLWLADQRDAEAATAAARRFLDLDADPAAIDERLGRDALLRPLVTAAPGVRVAGHADGFELAVRAVIGQQISVAGARTIAGRLVSTYGEPLPDPVGGVTHVFPVAERMAAESLADLPMPASRQTTLRALAQRVAGGLHLDPGADRDEARRALLDIPGIGPWTADYVLMRALGDHDVFLVSDLGVRRALRALGEDDDPKALIRRAEPWRPWRSYAVQHLWRTPTT